MGQTERRQWKLLLAERGHHLFSCGGEAVSWQWGWWMLGLHMCPARRAIQHRSAMPESIHSPLLPSFPFSSSLYSSLCLFRFIFHLIIFTLVYTREASCCLVFVYPECLKERQSQRLSGQGSVTHRTVSQVHLVSRTSQRVCLAGTEFSGHL